MFSTICYMFLRNHRSDSGEWIHLKRGVVPWRVWPNRSTWTLHHALRWGRPPCGELEGLETKVGPKVDLLYGKSGCYENHVLLWCLAGIDYEKLELSSNDLVLLWEPDFVHGARLLHYILTQDGQRYSKPLKLGVELLVRVSPEGHFSVERHADTLLSHSSPNGRVGSITFYFY
ncbi:hypothetical protein M9H77_30944 [Catharanthus roseus]|uniref:Uncharacterized protein n=1 Tax=Catharanthus roseus TaxID=4058 RepID=A0ACB9ZYP3_CATRO|nr:hypothetical protein M9H77_30944 [Catharanthus roseus]